MIDSIEGWLEAHNNETTLRPKRDERAYEGNLRDIRRKLRDYKEAMLRLRDIPESSVTLQVQLWLDRAENDVLHYKRGLEKVQETLKSLKKTGVDNSNLFRDLMKHKKIAQVIVDGNYLMIQTKRLKHETVEPRRFLGRYQITIHVSNPRPLIENISYTCEGFDHFHINHREPCFGDYSQAIADYHAKGQIYMLVETCLQFLTLAYTETDVYVNQEYFFSHRRVIPTKQKKQC